MRIIDTIPHESMTISIFQMNDKFTVRFEAGMMEQSFKFTTDEVRNLDGLKAKINATFIERTRARFNDMFMQMRDTAQ
jgi:hypothetical protein